MSKNVLIALIKSRDAYIAKMLTNVYHVNKASF